MLIPVIKVRDKGKDGYIHIVGTNSHDSLIAYDDRLEYYNLQNGCGTAGNDEYGYEFVYEVNQWGASYVEFVTLEEFIKLSEQSIDENTKQMIAFYKAFAEMHKKEILEAKYEAGVAWDSAGEILE